MTVTKRIIPCLDVDNGRVVKGVKFVDIKDAGNPVEVAKRYNDQGADEITFLDITASSNNRKTILSVVEEVASQVFIPLTVGGGIRSVKDIRALLNSGADKITINTAAIKIPILYLKQVMQLESNALLLQLMQKEKLIIMELWEIYTHGGGNPTGINAVEWAKDMEN
jgi:cyclase